mmetsp:Transcript_20354/g.58867  ORF Transcript_20354/g.58867 Transcript_20354/m.58867 type:complete len:227 (-) Transcript_20354:2106-2786(-)
MRRERTITIRICSGGAAIRREYSIGGRARMGGGRDWERRRGDCCTGPSTGMNCRMCRPSEMTTRKTRRRMIHLRTAALPAKRKKTRTTPRLPIPRRRRRTAPSGPRTSSISLPSPPRQTTRRMRRRCRCRRLLCPSSPIRPASFSPDWNSVRISVRRCTGCTVARTIPRTPIRYGGNWSFCRSCTSPPAVIKAEGQVRGRGRLPSMRVIRFPRRTAATGYRAIEDP